MGTWYGGVRNSLLRHLRIALGVALACMAAVKLTQACSCNPNAGGVREAVANEDVVFRGTIVDIHPAKRDVIIDDRLQPVKRIAVFRVTQVWKGDVGETFEMPALENPGGVCLGFRPKLLVVGNELLVYASKSKRNGEYLTSICSRTQLANQSSDFEQLGQGTPPAKQK